MGKTPANKRLVIVAYPPTHLWPELDELAEKGHTIHRVTGDVPLDPGVDLVLGEKCWRMTEELRKYLPLAIKNARQERKPKRG